MFSFLSQFMSLHKEQQIVDKLAETIRLNPEVRRQFETSYAVIKTEPDHPLQENAKENTAQAVIPEQLNSLIDRIVTELVTSTEIWRYDGTTATLKKAAEIENPVTAEELMTIPAQYRPQLTGTLYTKDIDAETWPIVMEMYVKSRQTKDEQKAKQFYHHFRQGLDIMNLDPVLYAVIKKNQTSMGNWLPQIAEAVKNHPTLKIPATTIIKVPLPLLQLTRIEYESLNAVTRTIADRYCEQIFGVTETGDYFIKTGTCSSKYEFRNAHVTGSEVHELGQYFLFIHNRQCTLAGPLNRPSIYGAGTTVEWVVRDYIADKENMPQIYHGLPLHTEYRAFADFDTKTVLGVLSYWHPEVMKNHFDSKSDPDSIHDAITYRAAEPQLMANFEQNKFAVTAMVQKLLRDTKGLSGQWSIDIMQNGNDFWLIDMAPAQNSALSQFLPENALQEQKEDWLPDFSL